VRKCGTRALLQFCGLHPQIVHAGDVEISPLSDSLYTTYSRARDSLFQRPGEFLQRHDLVQAANAVQLAESDHDGKNAGLFYKRGCSETAKSRVANFLSFSSASSAFSKELLAQLSFSKSNSAQLFERPLSSAQLFFPHLSSDIFFKICNTDPQPVA